MDRFSFLNTIHAQLIDDLYEQYKKYPDALEPSWKAFFQGFDFALENYGDEGYISENGQPSVVVQQVSNSNIPDEIRKEFLVMNLIEAYRSRGHLFTKTNPVRDRRTYSPTLSIENFGLSTADLNTKFNCAIEIGLKEATTLQNIINRLETIYCNSIGVEYMHIDNVEEKKFIRDFLQQNENKPQLSSQQKIEILRKLNQAVVFENYLNTKFVGQKRFSLEGNESLIPALDQLIIKSAKLGVQEVV